MDKDFSKVEAELIALGFQYLTGEKMIGRVPSKGSINGIYIWVEIKLEDFPVKQPVITLKKINEKETLYKDIPKNWRHIDEFLWGEDPKRSSFHVCCLHNWRAKKEYDGRFIYERIESWLASNTTGTWSIEEDLATWRILPQFSLSQIYLTTDFLKTISGLKVNTLYQYPFLHSRYLMVNGGEARKENGTHYTTDEINFRKLYYYLPEGEDVKFKKVKLLHPNKEWMKSTFFILKLASNIKFKTLYQLIEHIRCNYKKSDFPKGTKNVPMVVYYKGDKGREEAASFVLDLSFFSHSPEYKLRFIQIETIPDRPVGVDLNVGILGTGSLGSQVARILTDKGTKKIYMYDFDRLSAENLGHHELSFSSLGLLKKQQLKLELFYRSINTSFYEKDEKSDLEVAEKSDILVVTVGNNQAFDRHAFETLKEYKKPIIWAWLSPNSILQEIVISTPQSGCLNCYYIKSKEDQELKQVHQTADKEIESYPIVNRDLCGNPHVVSQWERVVFLATQIVSILANYSKNKRFKFDYVNYYWGMDDIIPTAHVGFLDQHSSCFCRGVHHE
jgi:hypothetical protein